MLVTTARGGWLLRMTFCRRTSAIALRIENQRKHDDKNGGAKQGETVLSLNYHRAAPLVRHRQGGYLESRARSASHQGRSSCLSDDDHKRRRGPRPGVSRAPSSGSARGLSATAFSDRVRSFEIGQNVRPIASAIGVIVLDTISS